MYIKNLKLKNYRNYNELDLNFNSKVNLILGNNAQGKTNLIESIYMTAFGKSFRTNKDKDLLKFDENFYKIRVNAINEIENFNIEIIFKDSKKYIKTNDKNIKNINELIGKIIIIVFSPEDLKIVKEEPSKRRKFIDRELCQIYPKYYDSLLKYKKVLNERNIYLKENNINYDLLDILNIQLAKYGAIIIKKRESFLEKLNLFSNNVHKNITGNKENLVLKYEPNIKVLKTQKETEDFIYETLKQNIEKDIKFKNTTKGCHKDDFSFYVNGINMRDFGSQGQQRTCSLSIKLAELDIIKEVIGEDAILLLDDVMSELDNSRQEFLIRFLQNNQLFITSTYIEENIISKFPNSNVYEVNNGIVKIK